MNNRITYGPHLFPGVVEAYIRTSESADINEAHCKIKNALAGAFSSQVPNSVLSQLQDGNLGISPDVNLSFMNYGDMQLVYLATLAHRLKLAVLINQPHTPPGRVKKEYENLQRLADVDPRFVVRPLAYFRSEADGHELYATEYVDNARCIAVQGVHGMYDPSPHYHFEPFAPEISSEVNSCMISLLVKYYDSERRKGISKTHTSGDDFILTRNFRRNEPETIGPNMKIIAAREFIDCSLDEYLDLVRREFLLGTYYKQQQVMDGRIKVNTSSKLPMTAQEIERGIELGMNLRTKR